MNQNFSFRSKFGETYIKSLREGFKDMTNRSLGKMSKDGLHFRERIGPGDIMHCFVDSRSKNSYFLFDVPLLKIIKWSINELPLDDKRAKIMPSPRKGLTWFEFAQKDGIEDYSVFVDFFKHRNDDRMLCFIWNPEKRTYRYDHCEHSYRPRSPNLIHCENNIYCERWDMFVNSLFCGTCTHNPKSALFKKQKRKTLLEFVDAPQEHSLN